MDEECRLEEKYQAVHLREKDGDPTVAEEKRNIYRSLMYGSLLGEVLMDNIQPKPWTKEDAANYEETYIHTQAIHWDVTIDGAREIIRTFTEEASQSIDEHLAFKVDDDEVAEEDETEEEMAERTQKNVENARLRSLIEEDWKAKIARHPAW